MANPTRKEKILTAAWDKLEGFNLIFRAVEIADTDMELRMRLGGMLFLLQRRWQKEEEIE